MLRFQHQEYFILLLLVVIAVVVYFMYQLQRKKKITKLGDQKLVESLTPSYSALLNKVKFIFLALALFFGVIGLANLQKSGEVQQVAQKGIDVVIALDVSNSMYAQDLKPSRLEKAKLFTNKLIDGLSSNRLAFILFAGRPYLSVPLTSDVEALKMNLSLASPEQVPTQGTVLGDALQMARETFNTKDAKHKAVIVISDGEDHDEKALNEVKKLSEEGITICTIGIGSEQGAPIPLPNNEGFKKDGEGKEIISKMNEEELQKLADVGNGMYIRLNNITSDVASLKNQLEQIEKSDLGNSRFTNYSSYFQYFLAFMLLFMLIEFFMPNKKSGKRLRTAFHLLLLMILPQIVSAQTATDRNIYKGNEFYKKGKYTEALAEYQKAAKKKENKKTADFNMGNSHFKNKNSEEAIKKFNLVGASAINKKVGAAAYHNAGNVRAQEQKWQEAINYYKASLKKNPTSAETKYNLAYAQQKLKQEQKKKDQDDKKKDDKKKDKDKDKKEEPKKPKDDKNSEDKNKEDKPEDKKEKEQQKPKPQPSKISKDQADKILDALGREEKKIKDKKEKGKAERRMLEKDW